MLTDIFVCTPCAWTILGLKVAQLLLASFDTLFIAL